MNALQGPSRGEGVGGGDGVRTVMSFVPVSTSLMSLFKATSLVEILP